MPTIGRMSAFQFRSTTRRVFSGDGVEHVQLERPLRRILAFTRRTIDDVINDPIARNEVRSYYKLQRWINRRLEIRDLEKQWNPLGRS